MAAGLYAPYPTKTSAISFGDRNHLATQIGSTGAVWALLLFPDPAGDPELQLLPVATGEEQRHVPLDDEAVVAVPHLPVAVADAPGGTLPDHLPPVGTDLEAVAVVLRLILVPHETEECHVYRCHPKLERLKVEAEVLPEAVKHLLRIFTKSISRFIIVFCANPTMRIFDLPRENNHTIGTYR